MRLSRSGHLPTPGQLVVYALPCPMRRAEVVARLGGDANAGQGLALGLLPAPLFQGHRQGLRQYLRPARRLLPALLDQLGIGQGRREGPGQLTARIPLLNRPQRPVPVPSIIASDR
jgi:hypothetical protein